MRYSTFFRARRNELTALVCAFAMVFALFAVAAPAGAQSYPSYPSQPQNVTCEISSIANQQMHCVVDAVLEAGTAITFVVNGLTHNFPVRVTERFGRVGPLPLACNGLRVHYVLDGNAVQETPAVPIPTISPSPCAPYATATPTPMPVTATPVYVTATPTPLAGVTATATPVAKKATSTPVAKKATATPVPKSAKLAHTGSETSWLTFGGLGLLALGAMTLVARRISIQPALATNDDEEIS